MASPLARIPPIIHGAFKTVFYDATLTRAGAPTGPDYNPTPGTVLSFTCKALIEGYSDYFKAGGLVTGKDREVMILAGSLATTPAMGDSVTVQGVTFTLSDMIEVDPARALWTCKGAMV